MSLLTIAFVFACVAVFNRAPETSKTAQNSVEEEKVCIPKHERPKTYRIPANCQQKGAK